MEIALPSRPELDRAATIAAGRRRMPCDGGVGLEQRAFPSQRRTVAARARAFEAAHPGGAPLANATAVAVGGDAPPVDPALQRGRRRCDGLRLDVPESAAGN